MEMLAGFPSGLKGMLGWSGFRAGLLTRYPLGEDLGVHFRDPGKCSPGVPQQAPGRIRPCVVRRSGQNHRTMTLGSRRGDARPGQSGFEEHLS